VVVRAALLALLTAGTAAPAAGRLSAVQHAEGSPPASRREHDG
jgi:hypothetical protein